MSIPSPAPVVAAVQDMLDCFFCDSRITADMVNALSAALTPWQSWGRPRLSAAGTTAAAAAAASRLPTSAADADTLMPSEDFWDALVAMQTPEGAPGHQALLHALTSALCEPTPSVLRLRVCGAYLKWLQVPGAASFGVADAHTISQAARVLAAAVTSYTACCPGVAPSRARGEGGASAAVKAAKRRAPRGLDEEEEGEEEPDERMDVGASQPTDGEDEPMTVAEPIPADVLFAVAADFVLALSEVQLLPDTLPACCEALVTLQLLQSVSAPALAVCATASSLLGRYHDSVVVPRLLAKALLPLLLASTKTSAHTPLRRSCVALLSDLLRCRACLACAGPSPVCAVSAVATLLQHLCVAAPERAEARACARELVLSIAALLPALYQRHFVRFLVRLARNKKPALRLLSVELCAGVCMCDGVSGDVIVAPAHGQRQVLQRSSSAPVPGTLMSSPSRPARLQELTTTSPSTPSVQVRPDDSLELSSPLPTDTRPTCECLIDVVVQRGSDAVPSVRAKAVELLAAVLSACTSHAVTCGGSGRCTGVCMSAVVRACVCTLPLLPLALRRLGDDRPAVRKAAVALAHAHACSVASPSHMVTSSGAPVGRCTLLALVRAGADDSSLVRKAVIGCVAQMSGLVGGAAPAAPIPPELLLLWLDVCLPLVCDSETSVSGRAVDAVAVVLERLGQWQAPVCAYASDEAAEQDMPSVWSLLGHVSGDSALESCLRKALAQLRISAPDVLKRVFKAGQAAVEFSAALLRSGFATTAAVYSRCAWLLLSELVSLDTGTASSTAPQSLRLPTAFLLRAWTHVRTRVEAPTPAHALISDCVDVAAAGTSSGTDESVESGDAVRIVRVLGQCCGSMTAAELTDVTESLAVILAQLSGPPSLLGACVHTLSRCVSAAAAADAAGAAASPAHPQAWAQPVLKQCEVVLRDYMLGEGRGADTGSGSGSGSGVGGDTVAQARTEHRVCLALYVVGEIAAVGLDNGPKQAGSKEAAPATAPAIDSTATGVRVRVAIPSAVVTLVRALIDTHFRADGLGEGGLARCNTIDSSVGMSFSQSVGPDGAGASFATSSYAPALSAAVSASAASPIPSCVRAHAFVSVGKLALRDGGLARAVLLVLVRELRNTHSHISVRSNVLLLLSDMCVKYTAMVDRFLPHLAACLRDEHPLLRKHAAIAISQLLLEDYAKWRGALFFQYLVTLADPDTSVAMHTLTQMQTALCRKAPLAVSSLFVPALFVLHGVTSHPDYNATVLEIIATASDRETSLSYSLGCSVALLLGGSASSDVYAPTALATRRVAVLTRALALLSPEHKFTVCARMTQDVLAAVVDGLLPLTDEAGRLDKGVCGLLEDVFALLSCEDLSALLKGKAAPAGSNTAENGDDESAARASNVAAASGRIMGQMSRKHVVDAVVPVLVALKALLATCRSPVLGALTQYFAWLYCNCKDTVEQCLLADPELGAEVLYDLRQQQEKEREARKRKHQRKLELSSDTPAAATLSASPTVHPVPAGNPLNSGRLPSAPPSTPLSVSRSRVAFKAASAACVAATAPSLSLSMITSPKLVRATPGGVASIKKSASVPAGAGAGSGAGARPLFAALDFNLGDAATP